MKSDVSIINEYKQHIQSEAKYVTPENFKELGELINGEIGLLTHYQTKLSESSLYSGECRYIALWAKSLIIHEYL